MKPCICKNLSRRNDELARVKAAIRQGNKAELVWAIDYCKGARARAAKDKKSFWRDLHDQAELLLLKRRSSQLD